jgi:hypothetical protein
LYTEINGHSMGSELECPADEPRRIGIALHGTCAIERVEIIRNNRVILTETGDGRWDIDLTHGEAGADRPLDYYYVHVVQCDGEQAWASPIWVSSRERSGHTSRREQQR